MRLSKDVGNTHNTYLYQNGLLVQETIGDKVLDYSYTSGGQIVAVRYKANTNTEDEYYYYALNSRGDVVGLYDHTGALYAKYTYDVWGNPVSVTNATGAGITSPTDFANIQPIRYRSYYYDTDTGFYYLQSRYYDPVTHRFINADNQISVDNKLLGYNLFLYGDNNPTMNYDPTGNFSLFSLFRRAVRSVVRTVVKALLFVSVIRVAHATVNNLVSSKKKPDYLAVDKYLSQSYNRNSTSKNIHMAEDYSGLMYNKANRDNASQKIYERLDDDSKISVKDISTEIFAHKFIDDVTKPMQPIEKYLPESLRFNTSARNADIGGYDKRMPVFIFIEKVFEYE